MWLIAHIPDVQERQVVYFGAYANVSRLRLLLRQATEGTGEAVFVPVLEEPTPFERQRRIRWAQLIQKVYAENPLLCPDCGAEVRIISFITDPPVVDKILRHIKWHPGQPSVPYIRPPPEIPKVAESLPSARK